MCLSTVYKNTKEESSVILRNVMKIQCQGSTIVLTDLMDRQVAVEGQLVEANLVDGFVIVKTN